MIIFKKLYRDFIDFKIRHLFKYERVFDKDSSITDKFCWCETNIGKYGKHWGIFQTYTFNSYIIDINTGDMSRSIKFNKPFGPIFKVIFKFKKKHDFTYFLLVHN